MLSILSYDPFDRGEMRYEAKTMLKSHPDYPYDDGVRRVFLYADGKINPEVLSKAVISDGKRIRDMLHQRIGAPRKAFVYPCIRIARITP
ncbi:MAG: hypothetical protein IJP92_14220 [Lachnospiraceae bacterium]|nr:hypothetical protein [Lachnospiraceae bacterium]